MQRPLKRWDSQSAVFRVALSLSILWIAGSLGYGLFTGSLQDRIESRYLKKIETACSTTHFKLTAVEGNPFADLIPENGSASNVGPSNVSPSAICQATTITTDSGWDKFWAGDPLLVIFLYVFAVPTALLLAAGSYRYSAWRISSYSDRYVSWIKGSDPS